MTRSKSYNVIAKQDLIVVLCLSLHVDSRCRTISLAQRWHEVTRGCPQRSAREHPSACMECLHARSGAPLPVLSSSGIEHEAATDSVSAQEALSLFTYTLGF
jgi:hypothetical protein